MTDDQFNDAMAAYGDRTKAVEYVGHSILGLVIVIAVFGGAVVGCLIWIART